MMETNVKKRFCMLIVVKALYVVKENEKLEIEKNNCKSLTINT